MRCVCWRQMSQHDLSFVAQFLRDNFAQVYDHSSVLLVYCSFSLNTLLSITWRRPTNMHILWCSANSEAYTSGLSGPTGHPTEVFFCFFFERNFWKCRQLTHHWFYYRAALYAGRSFLWASVRPSVCLSVCQNAWIVTKRKHLAKKVQLWLIGSRPRAFQWA